MKDISNVKTEDIEQEMERPKNVKKFFSRKEKYHMAVPDLELEDYLTPDGDGNFTCAICHAPILPEHKYRRMKNGVCSHESCMLYYGGLALKHPLAYKKDVDAARAVSLELYGDRKRKVERNENEFE